MSRQTGVPGTPVFRGGPDGLRGRRRPTATGITRMATAPAASRVPSKASTGTPTEGRRPRVSVWGPSRGRGPTKIVPGRGRRKGRSGRPGRPAVTGQDEGRPVRLSICRGGGRRNAVRRARVTSPGRVPGRKARRRPTSPYGTGRRRMPRPSTLATGAIPRPTPLRDEGRRPTSGEGTPL